jgi:hypothetical protein
VAARRCLGVGVKRWLIAAGVLVLALTGTLAVVSHERLSRQEALDAAAVIQMRGRRVEAKLMHFSDLARAYPAVGQPLWPQEKLIGDDELVWVILMSGFLLSPSCGAPITPGAGQCQPNWTLLVVRDRRSDLPPPKNGQAGTRASIVQANYTDDWASFFGSLPNLESVPILF